MDKNLLKKLFTPDQPTTVTATIRRRLGPGRYELTDDAGRNFPADSFAAWAPGGRVIVQFGRIVDQAGQVTTIKTYEV